MSSPAIVKDGTLYRGWTLWYLIPDRYTMKDADWKDFLHKVCDFHTIDEMWAALNSLEKAAFLPKGCRYYVFKKGVVPLWEDSANANGFELSIEHQIAKAKKQKVNDRWEDALLAVLGESIPNSETVNGVEFTVRTETFKISYWIAKCSDEVKTSLAAELKKVAKWNSEVKITPLSGK